ncbi:MAG: endonuclease/exonuclease/phosphatase family protein, partial [Candidatus Babeliales bacterium]
MKKLMLAVLAAATITNIYAERLSPRIGITRKPKNEVNFSILTINMGLLALTTDILQDLGGDELKKIGAEDIVKNILNIFGLGGSTKLMEVGKLKHNKERALLLSETLKRLQREGKLPGIVLMQEGFDVPVVKNDFYKAMSSVYPYHYQDERAGRVTVDARGKKIKLPIGTNSGLSLFSMYPLKKVQVWDYECFVGEGAFARKGLLGAEVNINGQTVYVFTTHLQAGVGAEPFKFLNKENLLPTQCKLDGKLIDPKTQKLTTDDVRKAELQQAAQLINQFATDKKAPVILAGDFNMNANDPKKIETIKSVFPQAELLYNAGKSAPHTGTVWNVTNKMLYEGNRIDHRIMLRYPGNCLSGDAWIVA